MKTKKRGLSYIIYMILIALLCLSMSCREKIHPAPVLEIIPNPALVGQSVELNAWGSVNVAWFDWYLNDEPEGSTCSIILTENNYIATIIPDLPGIYTISLIASSEDEVTVTIRRSFEAVDGTLLANAGEDNYFNIGEEVILDGTNSLPGEDFLNFSWSIINVPTLSEVSTSSLNTPNDWICNFIMDEPGTFEVELYVESIDDNTQFDRDTVLVMSMPPQIDSFEPPNGSVGTEVTIKGRNFSSFTEGNTVKFNGTLVEEILSASDTLLTVMVPEGATTGKIAVGIVENGDEKQSIYDFVIGEMAPVATHTTYNILNDVTFSNQDHGVVVGHEGAIFITNDGGYTWSSKSGKTEDSYNAVSFGSSNTGYIVGQNGTVLKTTNGGNSWEGLSSGTTSHLLGVSFVGENTGYIAGEDPAVVLKTEDGGLTWEDVIISALSGDFSDIFFITENVGIATGQYGVYSTTDGGINWVSAQSGWFNQSGYQISMVTEERGWIAGYNSRIAVTNDGGINFSQQDGGTENQFCDVHFMDENNGMVVGINNAIMKTTNAGGTWEVVDIGLDNHHYYGVYMLQANTAVVIGYDNSYQEGKIILLN